MSQCCWRSVPASADDQIDQTTIAAKNREIRRLLAQPVVLDGFDPGTPLKEALDLLAERYSVPIVIRDKDRQLANARVALPRMFRADMAFCLQRLLKRAGRSKFTARYRIRNGMIEVLTDPEDRILVGSNVTDGAIVRRRSELGVDRRMNIGGINPGEPLRDVLEFLSELNDVPIYFSVEDFEQLGWYDAEHSLIALPAANDTLGNVLSKLLVKVKGPSGVSAGFLVRERWIEIVPTPRVRSHLAFSADDRYLASTYRNGIHGTVRLWDVKTGRELHRVSTPGYDIRSFGFDGAGKLVTAALKIGPTGDIESDAKKPFAELFRSGNQGVLSSWNCATAKESRRLPFTLDKTSKAQHLTVGGSNALFALPTGNKIILQEPNSKEPKSIELPQTVDLVALAGTSPTLVAVCGKTLHLLDSTGRLKSQIDLAKEKAGIHFPISWLGASKKWLAFCDAVGRFHVWNLATGQRNKFFPALEIIDAAAFSPDGSLIAVKLSYPQSSIAVVHVPSGRMLFEFTLSPEYEVDALAFSHDGKFLAAGCLDGTVILWKPMELKPMQLQNNTEKIWQDLASENGLRAFQIYAALADSPTMALRVFRKHLQPVDGQRIRQLVRQLNDDDFKKRVTAEAELMNAGSLVVPILQEVLAKKPSLEVRRRAERILNFYQKSDCRALMAVTLLEKIASPEAQQILAKVAGGESEAFVTMQAKAALQRLQRAQK
ncbi:MAG: hypothetical protein KatS3mg105_0829 [Gemmatales bacterium]|nr:MAG: hypothetical protein KatS3mg105_0829 [Gemmatales bacterium]